MTATLTRILLITSLIAALNGCAVMNEGECKNANWYAIGFQDGSQGASANAAGSRSSACAEYNVKLNFTEYQQGYNQGIKQFCNASSGFYAGSNGYQYQGVCPSQLAPDFLSGYRQGQQLYRAKQHLSQAKQKLEDAQFEIDSQQQQLQNLKQKLIYGDFTPAQRQRILNQIEQLNDNKHDLTQLQRQVDRAQYKLQDLKRRLHY